jgi:hypothetical protein
MSHDNDAIDTRVNRISLRSTCFSVNVCPDDLQMPELQRQQQQNFSIKIPNHDILLVDNNKIRIKSDLPLFSVYLLPKCFRNFKNIKSFHFNFIGFESKENLKVLHHKKSYFLRVSLFLIYFLLFSLLCICFY